MKPPTKKPRKSKTKKRKYISGLYESTKMNAKFIFRSSWERMCMEFFDACDDIVAYQYETVKIPYAFPKKNGRGVRIRIYIPDFIIEYKDGHKEMWEIKPRDFQELALIQVKKAAAVAYCKKHGIQEYKFMDILDITKLLSG